MKTREEVIREYDERQADHDSYKAAYPDSNQADLPLNVTAQEAHMVELLREADKEIGTRINNIIGQCELWQTTGDQSDSPDEHAHDCPECGQNAIHEADGEGPGMSAGDYLDLIEKIARGERLNVPQEPTDMTKALDACIRAIDNEWLYQTGQFSRLESPPSNYPAQGSVHGDLNDARATAQAALDESKA